MITHNTFHLRLLQLIMVVVTATSATILPAEVGDPTIQTDHPQYAGEGAFQDVEDCVQFATAGKKSPQEQAIALYLWMLTHQFHLHSPQEWCIPGRVPDSADTRDYEQVVYDANRGRFSYGYGLCGTVHAWNEPYWQAAGMPARRRAFPGHTNSEIFYENRWHAYDTDMAGLLFRKDGIVAGYEDIINNPKLVDEVKSPLPHYPFAWPSDFQGMKKGWQQVAKGGSWYKLYNGGYAAHPGIVHLRSGETFTRFFDRDYFGGPSRRLFWHNQKGGPFRDWTFLNNGTPKHTGKQSNSRGNASYCNGEFSYIPDLSSEKFREGMIAESGPLSSRTTSPKLHSKTGDVVSVTFRHFSPYVIAGDPVDDANPMSGKATNGFMVRAQFQGTVRVTVSNDEGQSWIEAKGNQENSWTVYDFTEQVKGRYGWRVKFEWKDDAGIDALEFNTITQINQAMYPRLKPNGTTVTYRAASRGVVAVLPDSSVSEEETKLFEDVDLRSENVKYLGRSEKSRIAYRTTNNRPGQIVFRIESPEPLEEVRAAVRYQIRVPTPKGHDYNLEVSTDEGRSWKEFAKAEIPEDNEFSSGWLSGKVNVSQAGSRTALVRVQLYAGGYQTGLIDAQFYGVHTTQKPQALKLTYGWNEGQVMKTHVEEIPAGATEQRFQIPTGNEITDDFIRLSAP